MLQLKGCITILLIFGFGATFAQTTTTVNHFNKVVVSPYIQVTFIEGDKESVTIKKSTVDNKKIHIEVHGKTLRIYLDGAKEVPKNEVVYEDGNKVKQPLYKGTVVSAIVTYTTLDELSVRGEETQVCKSLLKGDKFTLKIYGESKVFLDEVKLSELRTTIYGESMLEIKSGSVIHQKYVSYGESKINSLGIKSSTTKITAYGEADFRVNVSDKIKITAFGDATLAYSGNPEITRGLHIGDVHIDKID